MKPTQIDLAQSVYYQQYSELIQSFDPWETLRYCAACGGELQDGPYLYTTEGGKNPMVPDIEHRDFHEGDKVRIHHVSCPHCKVSNGADHYVTLVNYTDPADGVKKKTNRKIAMIVRSKPIQTEIWFRRKVWLEKRRRKLFRWVGQDRFFFEYKEPPKAEESA